MAEILLSLTIIGVVAAITLPSLTGNINERTWNTQRKALYSRMSQAVALMPALNGYGQLRAASGTEGEADYDAGVDTAAETFITNGLAKVLKINNICDNTHLADCGMVTSYRNLDGTQKDIPTTLYSLSDWFRHVSYEGYFRRSDNTKAAAFETANGESLILYYNRSCDAKFREVVTGDFGFSTAYMCLNFIYDLNGKKGPNTIGKDMGVLTVFNATDPIVVAPIPVSVKEYDTIANTSDAARFCTNLDDVSRMPNVNELASMAINKDVLAVVGHGLNSSTTYGPDKILNVQAGTSGIILVTDKTYVDYVKCIRR